MPESDHSAISKPAPADFYQSLKAPRDDSVDKKELSREELVQKCEKLETEMCEMKILVSNLERQVFNLNIEFTNFMRANKDREDTIYHRLLRKKPNEAGEIFLTAPEISTIISVNKASSAHYWLQKTHGRFESSTYMTTIEGKSAIVLKRENHLQFV